MLVTLLSGATTLGPGAPVNTVTSGLTTFQGTYTGTASSFYPAQANIEASLDGVNFNSIGGVGASAATGSQIITVQGKWSQVRANVISLGGPAGSESGTFTIYALD